VGKPPIVVVSQVSSTMGKPHRAWSLGGASLVATEGEPYRTQTLPAAGVPPPARTSPTIAHEPVSPSDDQGSPYRTGGLNRRASAVYRVVRLVYRQISHKFKTPNRNAYSIGWDRYTDRFEV
jgi:hypothetical protein